MSYIENMFPGSVTEKPKSQAKETSLGLNSVSENQSDVQDSIEETPQDQKEQNLKNSENLKNTEEKHNLDFVENQKTKLEKKSDVQKAFSDSDLIEALKEKGINLNSIDELKAKENSTSQAIDPEIEKFKKFREINNGQGSLDDFYNFLSNDKDWSNEDPNVVLAKYLSEVEELEDKFVSRQLKKLSKEVALSEDEYVGVIDYEEYLREIEDNNIDKELEHKKLYKKALNHYQTQANKVKETFNQEPKKPDYMEEYFLTVENGVKEIDGFQVEGRNIIYSDDDKLQMKEIASAVNSFIPEHFDQKGLPKNPKKTIEDLSWANKDFRVKMLQTVANEHFKRGQQSLNAQRQNITLQNVSENPVSKTQKTTLGDYFNSIYRIR